MPVTILPGDCLAILPTLPENSIDAIVTDPPYHLGSTNKRWAKDGGAGRIVEPGTVYHRQQTGFMGKQWDGGDIAFQPDVWRECLRVLKPGGHMIAFGGSRTHHRVWVAIEDAGFELRDTLMWVYGSGFPKSFNIAKSVQSQQRDGNPRFDNSDRSSFDHTVPTGLPGAMWQAATCGTWTGQDAAVTDPSAAPWQGWGTGLKPAYEPLCLARKPLAGTVAETVLQYGTGGLNIDACRVPAPDSAGYLANWDRETHNDIRGAHYLHGYPSGITCTTKGSELGRWPANLCHDGSDEVLAHFPQTGKSPPVGAMGGGSKKHSVFGDYAGVPHQNGYGDEGSAARFFYCAKATRADRANSKHPCIKPIRLIEYLTKLITPPNGTVLDPFAGSGTTGQAALNLGFDAILIEREAEYVADIERRFVMPVLGADV